jgi:hypothetical protein
MQHLATLVEMSSSKFVVGTTLTFRNTFWGTFESWLSGFAFASETGDRRSQSRQTELF